MQEIVKKPLKEDKILEKEKLLCKVKKATVQDLR
jgi:SUMO ligase MMS21 Smc5/6 complex component